MQMLRKKQVLFQAHQSKKKQLQLALKKEKKVYKQLLLQKETYDTQLQEKEDKLVEKMRDIKIKINTAKMNADEQSMEILNKWDTSNKKALAQFVDEPEDEEAVETNDSPNKEDNKDEEKSEKGSKKSEHHSENEKKRS